MECVSSAVTIYHKKTLDVDRYLSLFGAIFYHDLQKSWDLIPWRLEGIKILENSLEIPSNWCFRVLNKMSTNRKQVLSWKTLVAKGCCDMSHPKICQTPRSGHLHTVAKCSAIRFCHKKAGYSKALYRGKCDTPFHCSSGKDPVDPPKVIPRPGQRTAGSPRSAPSHFRWDTKPYRGNRAWRPTRRQCLVEAAPWRIERSFPSCSAPMAASDGPTGWPSKIDDLTDALAAQSAQSQAAQSQESQAAQSHMCCSLAGHQIHRLEVFLQHLKLNKRLVKILSQPKAKQTVTSGALNLQPTATPTPFQSTPSSEFNSWMWSWVHFLGSHSKPSKIASLFWAKLGF